MIGGCGIDRIDTKHFYMTYVKSYKDSNEIYTAYFWDRTRRRFNQNALIMAIVTQNQLPKRELEKRLQFINIRHAL